MTRHMHSVVRLAVSTSLLALALLPGAAHAQFGVAQADTSQGGAAAALEGGTGGATPAASAAAQQARSGGGSTGFLAPDNMLGTKEPAGGRRVISFDQAMGATITANFDLAIARERMFQTELLVRRAWSTVLPQLNANVSYNFNWPEIKFQSVTQSQLDAQVNGQRGQILGQASVYDAQAEASRADGDYNSELANRAIASQLRSQAGAIPNQTAPDAVAISPVHVLSGGLSVSMVLFNGRSIPLLLNAYDSVKQTRATLSRARTQALYLSAVGYFNALTTKRLIKIAETQVANLEKHLNVTRVRVEVGTLPALALKRAESDVVRARASLRTAQNAYEASLATLALTMGLDEAFEIGATPTLPLLEEEISEDTLIAQAEELRPDLQAARIAVQVAERNRIDALMRWMPTVSLQGNARATTNIRGFQSEPLTYSVLVNASLPLYDGGARYTAYRESGSQLRETQIALAREKQRVAMSVRGNLREVKLRKDNLENQRLALQLAEANARDARARFEVGAATNLEVLDAEQLVTSAALDLASAELELQISRLALSFTVGLFDPVVAPLADERSATTSNPITLSAIHGDAAPLQTVGTRVTAPSLAPPGRAARIPNGMPVSIQPSAVDLLRLGIVNDVEAFPNP